VQDARTLWSAFLRNDCGSGKDALLGAAQKRGTPDFLELHDSLNVSLLASLQRRGTYYWDARYGY